MRIHPAYLPLLILFAGVTSCTTVPTPARVNVEEQSRVDRNLGVQLAEVLDSRSEIRSDVEVGLYLRQLATRLAASSDELKGAPLGVLVVADREGKWLNYSLPGNRIYIASGLLRAVEYESELAAAIAFEFANLLHRHAIARLEENRRKAIVGKTLHPVMTDLSAENVQFFGPAGIFSFASKDLSKSVETAVGLLYNAGIDPRGMSRLWDLYLKHPKKSPYEPGVVEELRLKSRQEIAMRTPLRNPLVRSRAFLNVQSRMRQL